MKKGYLIKTIKYSDEEAKECQNILEIESTRNVFINSIKQLKEIILLLPNNYDISSMRTKGNYSISGKEFIKELKGDKQ